MNYMKLRVNRYNKSLKLSEMSKLTGIIKSKLLALENGKIELYDLSETELNSIMDSYEVTLDDLKKPVIEQDLIGEYTIRRGTRKPKGSKYTYIGRHVIAGNCHFIDKCACKKCHPGHNHIYRHPIVDFNRNLYSFYNRCMKNNGMHGLNLIQSIRWYIRSTNKKSESRLLMLESITPDSVISEYNLNQPKDSDYDKVTLYQIVDLLKSAV